MARRGKTGSFDDLIALPLACLLGALASALRRRHQRKTLADNMAAAPSANELNGMSWGEFELPVGDGFWGQKGYRVEKPGSGQRGAADAFQAMRPGDEPAATTEITAPVCPQCLGPMVRRVGSKGAGAGEAFWGCALFPKCRGTM